MLCNSLKGRVKYFITKYKNSHDESGRVAIIIDDKEIIQGDIFRYYKGYWEVEQEYKNKFNKPKRCWSSKDLEHDFENRQIENYIDNVRLENGIFDVWQFTDAVESFFCMSIDCSLVSSNPLIRLLAIVDRRVGKRTLKKLMESSLEQPIWLKYFYDLRFQAEGLIK